MIKTISYNDFSHYSYFKNNDSIQQFLNDLRDFHRQGGDLNHDVLNNTGKIETFESWMQNKLSNDPALFKQIVDEKLITNPFYFQLDHKNKIVTDIPGYGLEWMRKNFKLYKPYILEAIEKLAQEIQPWGLGFIEENDEDEIAIERILKRRSKNWSEYSKNTIEYKASGISHISFNRRHPLQTIAEVFNDADVFNVILKTDPQYTLLWQNKNSIILDFVSVYHRTLNNSEIAKIFYSYNIGRDIFQHGGSLDGEGSSQYMLQILNSAINDSDVEFIKQYINDFDVPTLDLMNDSDSLFLNRTKNIEIGKILFNKGAIVYSPSLENFVYGKMISHKIDPELLDFILNNDQKFKHLLLTDPTNDVFKQFFSSDRTPSQQIFDCIKVLVENHNYPLNILNFISLASKFESHEELAHLNVLQWGIEHGYDPRNCKTFIEKSIKERADGLKQLKLLQKKNLFNSYYPDPLYHLLANNITKDFATWLEKVPSENYLRNTQEQKLAWWGASGEYAMNLIFKNVNDFTQLSSSGLSWLYELSQISENKHSEKNSFLTKIIKKKGRLSFNISGVDHEGKNLFHHLFRYKKERMNYELVKIILENTDDNVAQLIIHSDSHGETPLALLLDIRLRNMSNSFFAIEPLLSKTIPHLNFDMPIKLVTNNKLSDVQLELLGISHLQEISSLTVYQIAKLLAVENNDNDLIEQLENCYNNWKLYHDLGSSLNSYEAEIKKPKI